jgi:hypothetical protein
MTRSADHPLVVAGILGGITGAVAAMMGGVRFRPEHLGPVPPELWTLDLFGWPALGGIHSHAGGFAGALLAFTVAGIVVAVMATAFVRRRLYGPG